MHKTSIVLFRRDLRLADHEPLTLAAEQGAVIPLYVFGAEKPRASGAGAWWLAHSLAAFASALKERGASLVVRRSEAYGSFVDAVLSVVRESGATAVHWHRGYEPEEAQQDAALFAALAKINVQAVALPGALLWDPEQVVTGQGSPFKVFTPFYRACLAAKQPGKPLASPKVLRSASAKIASLGVQELPLARHPKWASAFPAHWTPGEQGAREQFSAFSQQAIFKYSDDRDFPAKSDGVSHLSPHLHFGEISPRQLWWAAVRAAKTESWLRQLVWREFALYSLFHYPEMINTSMQPAFRHFPWRALTPRDARGDLEAWQRGRTGIPIVDAGMRELWTTGWMHNRVRMIVGSFLTKNLRIDWQAGAGWFWDTLVDADLANNTMGWQWVAGTGFDAAPYFRVFNPVLQAKKFDPQGTYIKKWVPELVRLEPPKLFAPWEASVQELKKCGIVLGVSYPRPLVDLTKSGKAFVAAASALK